MSTITTIDELRDAIAASPANGTLDLFITPGTTLAMGGAPLTISGKRIHIQSAQNGATLSGGGLSRLITVSSAAELTLTRVHLRDGVDTSTGGGALRIDGNSTATLHGVHIQACTSTTYGGAMIVTQRSRVTMTECTISDTSVTSTSHSSSGGAIAAHASEITIIDSSILNAQVSSGSATVFGGALYFYSVTATLIGVMMSSTMAFGDSVKGGAFYLDDGTATLTDVTISSTNASSDATNVQGGALCVEAGSATLNGVTISSTMASSNADVYGGALYFSLGTATLNDVTISATTASSGVTVRGGAIMMGAATVSLIGVAISSTVASAGAYLYGGALFLASCDAPAMLNNVTIYSSMATGVRSVYGGALYLYDITATLIEVTISSITLRSTSSLAYFAYGGAINAYTRVTLALIKSTIFNTSAVSTGGTARAGAIYLPAYGSHLNITNSSIASCSAIAGGTGAVFGGAISSSGIFTSLSGSTIDVFDSTVVGCWSYHAEMGNALGGAFSAYIPVVINMHNSRIVGCWCGGHPSRYHYGGAVFIEQASYNMFGGEIINCESGTYGGAVSALRGAVVSISDAYVSGCRASSGGALYSMHVNTVVNVSRTTIHNCTAAAEWYILNQVNGAGGGAFAVTDRSFLNLEDVTVTSCRAVSETTSAEGGALFVYSHASAAIVRSTFADSYAASPDARGGAIFLWRRSTVHMDSSSIANCYVRGSRIAYGGAVSLTAVSTMQATMSVVRGCRAMTTTGLAAGGGFSVNESSMLALSNVTVHSCATMIVEAASVISSTGRRALAAGEAAVALTDKAVLHAAFGRALQSTGPTATGGAISAIDSNVRLQHNTVLDGNTAPDGTAGLAISGNVLVDYIFPAPTGTWLPATLCKVHREQCPMTDSIYYAACEATRAECSHIASATNATAADGTACMPATFNQPCGWHEAPEQIGQTVFVLPGENVGVDFPFSCAPGIVGSAVVDQQLTPLCAGLCPAGKICGEPRTMVPIDCDAGGYCPPGTSRAVPCPSGSFSSATNLSDSTQCTACPNGHSCIAGSTAPAPCAAGSYVNAERASICTLCAGGEFQTHIGATACEVCSGGNFCPPGASAELPCRDGTYSNAPRLSIASQCDPCPPGSSCTVGSTAPRGCMPGSVAPGASQQTCTPCEMGTFQREEGKTACIVCSVGFYCRSGAAIPEPCPAGHVGTLTGLSSDGQCTPVAQGFWAPLGSSIPKPCPASGFYCPGALRDSVHGGAEPIIMPEGGSAEMRTQPALQKAVTLDISMEDFVQHSQALTLQLAARYDVHPSLITLQATPGSLQLTITIATTNGTDAPIDVGTLTSTVNAVDDSALTSSISQAMKMNVTITSSLPLVQTAVDVAFEFACERGQWHVA
jgi:hypothetical protein